MILKWKLLDFQINNVNETIFNMLVRFLIDRNVFVNKGSKSILKPYFVYRICLYIFLKKNKPKNQPSKVQVLCYCIIQWLGERSLPLWSPEVNQKIHNMPVMVQNLT